jgi:type VI secretion system secreted protein VgrG
LTFTDHHVSVAAVDDLTHFGITFQSPALPAEDVRIQEVNGQEPLGGLYEFHVTFGFVPGVMTQGQQEELLMHSCSLTLGPEPTDVIHGVVHDVEMLHAVEDGPSLYALTLVPSMTLLSPSKVSRVFQGMTVPEMASEILTKAGLGADDFELQILGKPLPREIAIQYEESDWHFLQRWFEYEGYYGWFQHGETSEKLFVSDTNLRAPKIAGEDKLPYRPPGNLVRTQDSVLSWTVKRGRTVGRVVLRDYNEQMPDLPMVAEAKVSTPGAFGVMFSYGEHFPDGDAGRAVAKTRAERCAAEHAIVRGRTDCPRFRAGHTFELTEHPDPEQKGTYLITNVEHRAGQLDRSLEEHTDDSQPVYGYRAIFEAIKTSVQFRPERKVQWPRIHGHLPAHIDGDTSGKIAHLDPQGRYRVRMLFDSTGKTGDKASIWVRMAQSHAGAGYGSHFPLHKGTEVLLSFVGGNPDRPMIVGAVPNAHTPGPTNAKNPTQSAVHTASGIKFVMDDGAPPSPPKSPAPGGS